MDKCGKVEVDTTLGKLQIRTVKIKDLQYINNLSPKLTDKEFARKVINNQLITEVEVSYLTEEDLNLICRAIVSRKWEDRNAVAEFRNYFDQINKDLKKTISNFNINFQLDNHLTESIMQIQKSADVMYEKLSSSFKPIMDFQKSICRIIEPITELQKNMAETFSFFDNWIEKNQVFFERIRKVQLGTQKDDLLLEHGWIITPYINKSSLYSKLEEKGLQYLKRKKNSELNNLFVDFFLDNNFEKLSQMINSWETNEFFKKRLKLIKDSLFLLQRYRNKSKNMHINPCSFIIPILIAQIDGITLDIALHIGFSLKKRINKKGEAFYVLVNPSGKDSNIMYAIEELYFNSFHDINSLHLFQDYLFSKAYPTKKPTNTIKRRPFLTFSRHKIMHGENIRYGTIDNTIRLFLILDFIANLGLDSNDSN